MKKTSTLLLIVLALALPLIPIAAQEDEAADQAITPAPAAQETAAEPAQTEAPAAASRPAPRANSPDSITSVINKVITLLAPIGALFGKATGFRIGGTTGTGIAALVIAKLVEDKAPSWVRYLLYAGGGTMFAGGGANIAQAVMQNIGF